MKNKVLFLIIIATLFILPLNAQQVNEDIRRGNREYKSENYQEAELNYRKALESNQNDQRALYNLGASLYRQGRYEEAAGILDGLSKMPLSDERKADVLHNLGNAYVNSQKIKEGVDAYKNSLRIRPDDMDTRHNLAQALRLLQEQEQQQNQQQQDQQDQQQDQEQQQQQQPQKPEENKQQEQQQPRPDQISPQDAQRILDALNQQEQKIQEKIDREQQQRTPSRPEREW